MPMDIDISRRNKVPRPLSEEERAALEEYIDAIHYSTRYVCSSPVVTWGVSVVSVSNVISVGTRTTSTNTDMCNFRSRC